MIAYVIIYSDVLGYIFAKPTKEMVTVKRSEHGGAQNFPIIPRM